jgi:hypothetical protein
MNTGKEPFKCGMGSAECGVRPNLISVIARHRAPRHALRCPCGIRNAAVASSLWLDPIRPEAERYTSRQGQPDNSPAFQRRVFAGTGTSPAGTAERTARGFHIGHHFDLQTSVVPSGLGNIYGFNPALKCRAIVIASLRDCQTLPPIVHPQFLTHISQINFT